MSLLKPILDSEDELVKRAIHDLAQRLEISKDSDLISVKKVVSVVWRDANLGYRKLNLINNNYKSGVPGYQITLFYENQEYDYHCGLNLTIFVPPGEGEPPLSSKES